MTRRTLGARALRAGGAAAFAAGLCRSSLEAAHKQSTTPDVADGAGNLASMLALAPDVPALPDQRGHQIAQFADSATQMAAAGVEPPESLDDWEAVSVWTWANWWMPFPDAAFRHAVNDEWRAVFGFGAMQIDRSLVVGEPPVQVAIMQGRFDEMAMIAAWEASGYRVVDEPKAIVYSIGAEQEIDFSSDVGQLALSSMNNLAIFPDGTLLAASRLDRLRAAIATARGEAESLLDRADLAALVTTGDPGIAAGYLIVGEALSASDPAAAVRLGPEERAAFDASGTMPPVRLALLGVTPGGPLPNAGDPIGPPPADVPDARFVVSLLMDDQIAAEAAVSVLEERLKTGGSLLTGAPYAEFFAGWDLDVMADAPVLRIVITPAADRTPDVGFRMYFIQDLGFLFWSPD